MSPEIVGIDPATKNLGLALGSGKVLTLNARADSKDPVRRLAELERNLETLLRRHPPAPDVIVIEGYALGSPGRLGLVRLGEVGGMARLLGFRLGAGIVEVAPSALKRFATGNGSAPKAAMLERAAELGAVFSRPVTGNEKTDPHDEADAFLCREVGRLGYGLFDRPPKSHELEVASGLVWPRIS